MTVVSQKVADEDRLGRVDALDLEPIVYKLMHPDPEEDAMSLAGADRDVAFYRLFLKLCVLHPGAAIVPTRDIDHVWHTHMLDTVKYRADCDWVFGFFLEHFPYFGFRGPEDRLAWLRDFAATRRLFREHFGVEITSEPAASACRTHDDASSCCIGCTKPASGLSRPRHDREQLLTGATPATPVGNGAQP